MPESSSPPQIPIDAPADIYGGDETKYYSAEEQQDTVLASIDLPDGQTLLDESKPFMKPR
jgi:hypothetical protein